LKASKKLSVWVGSALLLGAMAPACGGGGTVTMTSGTTGSGGEGTSSSSTGVGGATSASSSSGTGGGGGSTTTGAHGPGASQLVNGGDVVTSSKFKMVFTLGQPTQNQTETTSPGYRMQGGLVGANGTLP
jgi:hypothetical protein